jgi:hypothetical protein
VAVTVLIDADPVVYRVGFSLERRTYYVEYRDVREGQPDLVRIPFFHNAAARDEFIRLKNLHPDEYTSTMVPVPAADEAIVYGRVKATLKDIEHHVGAYLYEYGEEIGEVKVFLSGSTNFRNDVATITTYKGSRLNTPKPFWYQEIRDYMIRKGASVTEGIEADDAVSMEQFQAPEGTTIICTIDKDLRMIPGHHYNYHRKTAEHIKPGAAMRNFYRQICMGDSTDDIPGCFKVGKVKAAKVIHDGLRNESAMFRATLALYEENMESYPEHHMPHTVSGDALGSLTENARLLWMQRVPDQLWNPPGTPHGSVQAWLLDNGTDPDEDL